jgi:2-keto-4-pentenoate hydratase/2-oxohepta-3-ene-1,7-dioic acid hydratase in catechol pathway
MKLISFNRDGAARPGLWLGDGQALDLSGEFASVLDVLTGGDAATGRLRTLTADPPPGTLIALTMEELLAPIPHPERNLFCIGRNYGAHAAESQRARGEEVKLPKYATIFTKAPQTVVGPRATVRYDRKVSDLYDYEVELAVVIGKGGRDISRENAMDHVWGYTVANDVTARDLQGFHGQFFKGKSLDESCPIGPWFMHKDAVGDPKTLVLTTHINGEPRQHGTPADLIFDIPSLIETLSAGMALVPGDVILTGTPEGVGYAMDPPRKLKDGDVMRLEIDRIGVLENRIVEV